MVARSSSHSAGSGDKSHSLSANNPPAPVCPGIGLPVTAGGCQIGYVVV
jgi:hypothetical protein